MCPLVLCIFINEMINKESLLQRNKKEMRVIISSLLIFIIDDESHYDFDKKKNKPMKYS